jgi:hypothetical protein
MIVLRGATVSSSAGGALPKEVLEKLKLAKGDTLYPTDSPDGSIRIMPQGWD